VSKFWGSDHLLSKIIRDIYGVSEQKSSGMVIKSPWPMEHTFSITDFSIKRRCIKHWINNMPKGYRIPKEIRVKLKLRACIEHWINGIPWEDTGVYELVKNSIDTSKTGSWDGCKNSDDIVKRYKNLDLIFEQVKLDGRLRTNKENINDNFWEGKGSIIHIGPNGEPFLGSRGIHRFAIAYVLKIKFPGQIGLVHKSAIPFLSELRKE
jgi:hypothetical protein